MDIGYSLGVMWKYTVDAFVIALVVWIFLSEVADVMVMCEQFRLKYNTINSTMDYKINRQIQRIKQENSSVK
jgi:hypothetical protein